MSGARDYIREGAEIYRRSFAIIRAEADLSRFSGTAERAKTYVKTTLPTSDASGQTLALQVPPDRRADYLPVDDLEVADLRGAQGVLHLAGHLVEVRPRLGVRRHPPRHTDRNADRNTGRHRARTRQQRAPAAGPAGMAD